MTSAISSLWSILAGGSSVPLAQATLTYSVTATVGSATKSGDGSADFFLMSSFAAGDNGVIYPEDRFRIVVQNVRDKTILTNDLVVSNLQVMRQLSGPATIECDVQYMEPSAIGIDFKPWAQYIHATKVMQGKRRVFASGIVQPSKVDPKTGALHLSAKGFSCYPNGMPWLENIDWVTNDAFDPVVEIWDYLQSFPDGNLGVEVYPQKSNQIMLPGYSFDGQLWNMNFFATFVRATDRLDCGDYIDALAKDIPFDYREESEWNFDYTDITKRIHLGCPRLGALQDGPTAPVFVINENVIAATPATEAEIDWVSDVGISGWFPGVEYSVQLSNADPDRLRRYLDEEDAFIDSNERAQAWAHRKLARRQMPKYWSKISVIPDHPNAPLGTYDVADTITVSGYMPWYGNVIQTHKIMAMTISEKDNLVQLDLKPEGAFNYQPIYFLGDSTNVLDNGAFDHDLSGWTQSSWGGTGFVASTVWTWDGLQGITPSPTTPTDDEDVLVNASPFGSASITADGSDHVMISSPFGISDFQRINTRVYVKCRKTKTMFDPTQSPVTSAWVGVQFYDDTLKPVIADISNVAGFVPELIDTCSVAAKLTNAVGVVPWMKLDGYAMAPTGATNAALVFGVTSSVVAGIINFDDASLAL